MVMIRQSKVVAKVIMRQGETIVKVVDTTE